VVGLALTLRLAWVLTVDTNVDEFADPQWYYVTAKNVADGHGLTINVPLGGPQRYLAGPGGYEAVRWPPGYSLTLGGFFRVFGVGLTTAKVVNALAGTATVGLTFLLALRLFGRPVAVVAGVLMAVYPAHIVWSSVLYSDVVFALPFTAAVVIAVWSGSRPSIMGAAAIGLVLGYAAIIRPQAVMVLIAVAVMWLLVVPSRKRALLLGGVAASGVVLWLVPIMAWNTARTGEPTFISRNFGYNLRIGHAPYSTGRYLLPTDLWQPGVTEIRPGALPDEGIATRRAIKYALTHPAREAELSARKVYYLFTTDSDSVAWASNFSYTPIWGSRANTDRLGNIADLSAYIVLLLAFASVPRTFSLKRELGFIWLVLALWVAVHIAFFGEPRYRLPIQPILMTFAAVALYELYGLLPTSRAVTTEPESAPAD
jgi:4-amino-4-deoxy-L-arabinose transferase-like glycosyltransferase